MLLTPPWIIPNAINKLGKKSGLLKDALEKVFLGIYDH